MLIMAKKTSKQMGRPKKEIDQKIFEGLCQLQCTRKEMEVFLGVSSKTLHKWCKDVYLESFSTVFGKKRIGGLISLRRAGYQLAQNNAAVWIFHAKNFLGMKDQPVDEGDIAPAQPVSVNIIVQDCKSANKTDS